MSVKDTFKLMKDKEIEFVDLRFTDPWGKLQHLTMDATRVDEEMLDKGVFWQKLALIKKKLGKFYRMIFIWNILL